MAMASASFGDANVGVQAGIVNGQVSATFYLPPGTWRELSEDPSKRYNNRPRRP
jgi:hypothetical protein